MVYRMASQNDEETLRILDDCIFLAVLSNPDGLELVANWYMNDHVTGLPQTDPLKRSTSQLPVLYQKYLAHDNNREFYANFMMETQALARLLFHEWFPQIVYNQHQSGPSGTVLFAGAMRDPMNYNLDPQQLTSIENLSSHIHKRYVAEGKPGATCRSGSSYSLWYNGGLRTSADFHNMIGILTEITGSATPTRISFTPQKFVPKNDYPFPIMPQDVWHLSQAVDYLITADLAHLDYASKNREDLLFNIWRQGMNAIEKGSRDNWTWNARNIAEFMALPQLERTYPNLLATTQKDARGYIIPSDQPDFLTAIKFVNSALRGNAAVLRATQDFVVGGKAYPKGSLVVKNAQPFRPHAMDYFEPLWHPDDIPCPGSPPTAPYDMAGYTLGFQMGVKFDSIYEAFDGPFEKITLKYWNGAKWLDEVKPPAGIPIDTAAAGYLLSHQVNDAFIAVNRLMKNGEEVYWLRNPLTMNGKTYPVGTMYIPNKPSVRPLLRELAKEKGLNFEAAASKPTGEAFQLQAMRIGLADVYGGNSTEGWTQFMLEQFEFSIQLVYPQEIDAGNLNAKYDVLIFEDGFIPSWSTSGNCNPPDTTNYAPQYKDKVGSLRAKCISPRLIEFMQQGGTILTIDSSTRLGYYPDLGLPIANHVAGLTRTDYYVPPSVLEVAVDNSLPIAYGMPDHVDVLFDNSAVFDITGPGPTPIAWFDSPDPLRSGWAWGREVLEGRLAGVQAQVGDGTLFMFGPLICYRAQPHGTFKFIFNGIYYGGLIPVTL
jgi:hypothetical protein